MRRANEREVAHSDVIDELGDWASGPGPLFRQLGRALARAIERGVFGRGTRLPPERLLAAALHVSRGTAVAAYDVLVGDGLVERRRGSGTFVVGAGALALPPGREGSALVHRLVERSAGPSSLIDLSISVLHDASRLPAVDLSSADLAAVDPDTGYSPWGLTGLRSAVAEHVTGWGLPTRPEEIVITTGAQQGISAAAACWLRPGDTVVVEDPSYPGAIAAFGQAGARLRGVRVDADGVRVHALAAALADRPALVYLQSTVHSPTGAVLPERRRRAIARLVDEARVPLLEDLALADLAWEPAPPPIAAYAQDASVAVVGSLSKRFWGGLRLGWVRAPASLAVRFARVKATHDLGSSAVSQVLAERLLRASAPDQRAFADGLRAELRSRYDTLAAALATQLPDWRWNPPAGGLSVWVQLPTPTAERFAQVALRHGVAVATAPALSPSADAHPDRLRLSFSGPPHDLVEGVRRLAAAWAAHEWTGPQHNAGDRAF